MTELLITPNFGNKTAKFKGTVAAGEKVRVRIVGALQYLSDNLRLRFCNCKDTLAIFLPETSDGEWTANGDDLECTINLNTVQMLQFVKHSSGCAVSVIFDNPKEDVLYFSDFHYVEAWSREVGDDEPFDLSQFPGQIKSWEKRLDNLRVVVEEVAGGIELTICDGVSPAKTVTIFHGKEGQKGEQGVPGKKGEQGVPGKQGIPGKDLSEEVSSLTETTNAISKNVLTNSLKIANNEALIVTETTRATNEERELQKQIDVAKANAAGAMGAASKAQDAADSAVSQINTLAGYDAGKSVRTIAGEEARTAVNRVVDGAPETFDTLKEIAGYIKEDKTGAAQMAASIAQNAEAIAVEAARAKVAEQEIARGVANNESQISKIGLQIESKAEKSALDEVDTRVTNLEENGSGPAVDVVIPNADAKEKQAADAFYVNKNYRQKPDLQYRVTETKTVPVWTFSLAIKGVEFDVVDMTLVSKKVSSGVTTESWAGYTKGSGYYCTLYRVYNPMSGRAEFSAVIEGVSVESEIYSDSDYGTNAKTLVFSDMTFGSATLTASGQYSSLKQVEVVVVDDTIALSGAVKEVDSKVSTLNGRVSQLDSSVATKMPQTSSISNAAFDFVVVTDGNQSIKATEIDCLQLITRANVVAPSVDGLLGQVADAKATHDRFILVEQEVSGKASNTDLQALAGNLTALEYEEAMFPKIPKYKFEDAVIVDGVLTLQPYTNSKIVSDGTPFEIVMGDGGGKVQDCVLRVECGETAPTITWGANFHPRTDAETDFVCVAGKRNVYWITEHAPNEFTVAGWQETEGGNAA